MAEIGFRPLERADFPLLRDWMSQEHVAQWWGPEAGDIAGVGDDAPTLELVEERYGPELEDPRTRHSVVLVDGEPAGMIQAYLVADYPEYAVYLPSAEGAAIDLLVAQDHVGRGIGPQVIRTFARDVVLPVFGVDVCVASPDERNARSLRAFEKAGFTRGPVLDVPDSPTREVYMRATRGSLD